MPHEKQRTGMIIFEERDEDVCGAEVFSSRGYG